ncbi:MAG: helix-turn-helix domain-containing protein [Allorhizobium sp.]
MFSEIEERRRLAGIEQRALCQRAGVHDTTYSARKSGRRTLSERTINKLKLALEALIAEKREALATAEGRR